MICYLKTVLEENKYNSKRYWSILKQAIGKTNGNSTYPLIFNINEIPISDKNEIAERFNNLFSKIGTQTSNDVPITNKKNSSYMPPPQLHSILFGSSIIT